MDGSAWLIAFVLFCVAALAWIVGALLRVSPDGSGDTGGPDPLDGLFEEKARTLRAIKDLDQEHTAGTLDDADWKDARAAYVAEAAQLNREIERLSGVAPPDGAKGAP